MEKWRCLLREQRHGWGWVWERRGLVQTQGRKNSNGSKPRACSLDVTAHATGKKPPLRSGLAHPDADAIGGRHPKGNAHAPGQVVLQKEGGCGCVVAHQEQSRRA